jgi:hypothetical protein
LKGCRGSLWGAAICVRQCFPGGQLTIKRDTGARVTVDLDPPKIAAVFKNATQRAFDKNSIPRANKNGKIIIASKTAARPEKS